MDGQATISGYKIVKSNDLIQKSRFNLSAQEQKIILFIIAKIRPGDDELKLYEFNIKEFCSICGIEEHNGKNYQNLKNTIQTLADRSYWLQVNEKGTQTLMRWIAEPYIEPNNGTIKIRLDSRMRPYLLELKEKFTQYNLYHVLPMKSQYSIRLYELLKSYEYLKNWSSKIDELKRLLFADKYTKFNDFKRKVLDIALKEIQDFGDIEVSYILEKESRRFEKIHFTISRKKAPGEIVKTWKRIEQVIG